MKGTVESCSCEACVSLPDPESATIHHNYLEVVLFSTFTSMDPVWPSLGSLIGCRIANQGLLTLQGMLALL